MRKIASLFASALTLVALTFAFTRKDEQLDSLFARLEKFNKEYPQEKVHLQLDKPYYSVGEDIWFKAYVVNAERNVLSDQSKILYVDLIDDRDSVCKTMLLPLENGMTSANINLSDSLLTGGNYHLYAYTKWMSNFGGDNFFRKDIPIVNALHGAITGNMRYKAAALANGHKQLSTDLTFKNDNGTIFSNKPVTYTITANNKIITDGKALTDATGKLSINNTVKDEYKNSNIVINTTLMPVNGRRISQNFVIKPLADVADMQFFPEGGHWVNGIRTRLGFKAVKPDGLGENVTGYITDGDTEHLAEFKADHAGMGYFALQPVEGKTYTAVITHEDGSVKTYALPKPESAGYVLNVNKTGDSISVRISASRGLVDNRDITLVAQCNGLVQFAAKTKMDRASTVSYIPLKKFQTGITQFTLFGPDMVPLAERLVFVDHNDQLTAQIKTDKPVYAKRGKVAMDIKVTDAYNEPVVGSFSVSVTDAGKVKSAEDDETTILSNLLLTSDIKGNIEQPNYYFNKQNKDRQKHLDQLLLTQGWRRFNWADLETGAFPTLKYDHETSLTVSGTITTIGGKPVPYGKVNLFAKSPGGPVLLDTVADDKGRYVFTNVDITDSAKLVVRASNAKDRNTVKVTIDKKPRVPYVNTSGGNAFTDVSLADYLKTTRARFDELGKYGLMKNTIPLREVNIKARKDFNADKIIPHSAALSPGNSDIVLKADKIGRQPLMINNFYGLPGIEVKAGKVYRIGRMTSITGGVKPMMVIWDGAALPPDMINSIFTGDVLGVEILISGSNLAVYGNDGSSGVIIVTTKRFSDVELIDNSFNVAHYAPNGYSSAKQFYAPAYDTPADQTKMADLRSTIYWNPNIITDASGKAKVEYFNADGAGIYKVALEGIDTKGKLTRQTYTYVVQ